MLMSVLRATLGARPLITASCPTRSSPKASSPPERRHWAPRRQDSTRLSVCAADQVLLAVTRGSCAGPFPARSNGLSSATPTAALGWRPATVRPDPLPLYPWLPRSQRGPAVVARGRLHLGAAASFSHFLTKLFFAAPESFFSVACAWQLESA